MKKWDKLQATLTEDTRTGASQIYTFARNNQWQQARDIALQVTTGAAILGVMGNLDKLADEQAGDKEIRKSARRVRKAWKESRKAASQ